MLIAIILGSALVFAGAFFHFLALRKSAMVVDPSQHALRCFSLSMVIIIVAHLITALVFAAAFHVAEFKLGLGILSPTSVEAPAPDFMDRFYFSLVNLTTLGRGDLLPAGHLRFLTALEALLGFIVITGSGAFLLKVMSGVNPLRRS